MKEVLNEIALENDGEQPFDFAASVDSVVDQDGTYRIRIIDDEVGEITDMLGSEYPQVEERMDEFREHIMKLAEQE
jgi:hypothetical protein